MNRVREAFAGSWSGGPAQGDEGQVKKIATVDPSAMLGTSTEPPRRDGVLVTEYRNGRVVSQQPLDEWTDDGNDPATLVAGAVDDRREVGR